MMACKLGGFGATAARFVDFHWGVWAFTAPEPSGPGRPRPGGEVGTPPASERVRPGRRPLCVVLAGALPVERIPAVWADAAGVPARTPAAPTWARAIRAALSADPDPAADRRGVRRPRCAGSSRRPAVTFHGRGAWICGRFQCPGGYADCRQPNMEAMADGSARHGRTGRSRPPRSGAGLRRLASRHRGAAGSIAAGGSRSAVAITAYIVRDIGYQRRVRKGRHPTSAALKQGRPGGQARRSSANLGGRAT